MGEQDEEEIKGFLWDAENYHPVNKDSWKTTGKTEFTILTDRNSAAVKVKVKNASLKGNDVSVICYNPSVKAASMELSKNADAIVYLNQISVQNEETELTFKLKEKVHDGNYYILLGTPDGIVKENFAFEKAVTPDNPTVLTTPTTPDTTIPTTPAVTKPILKKGDVVKVKGVTCKVTSIRSNAFANMKKLTTVTIPKNVKSIGKKVFYNCKKLKNIKLGCTSPKSIAHRRSRELRRKQNLMC